MMRVASSSRPLRAYSDSERWPWARSSRSAFARHVEHARGAAAARLAQRAPVRVRDHPGDHRAHQLLGVAHPAVDGRPRDAELGAQLLGADALSVEEAPPCQGEQLLFARGRRRSSG